MFVTSLLLLSSQDQKLLKSVRLTEKMKLYDKYTGDISQQTVKVQFLNKIHRKNPPFRIKVRHPRRHTVKVRSYLHVIQGLCKVKQFPKNRVNYGSGSGVHSEK